MKKIFQILLVLVLLMGVQTKSNAFIFKNQSDEQLSLVSTSVGIEKPSSIDNFLTLTPKKYKELTGKRLGIKQTIMLKLAQRKLKKELNKDLKPASSSGKSQTVALVICILIGGLGIHRFYLGYVGIGIIQLLTLGGCGIWALIDLIRIITGDLKPKDGEYESTL